MKRMDAKRLMKMVEIAEAGGSKAIVEMASWTADEAKAARAASRVARLVKKRTKDDVTDDMKTAAKYGIAAWIGRLAEVAGSTLAAEFAALAGAVEEEKKS